LGRLPGFKETWKSSTFLAPLDPAIAVVVLACGCARDSRELSADKERLVG
jgi:hypothetical protein